MTDLMDRQVLMSLSATVDYECACCGITPLRADDADVVDLEILCLDCVACYHPDVYARRTGE